MIFIPICVSLLQLFACAMGTISTKNYASSSTLTGNLLKLTFAPSAVGCLTLCADYSHTSNVVCYGARYNGGTRDCELMSYNNTGEVQWVADNLWKLFALQCEPGWTMFHMSCYQLFQTKKTWDDAKSACEHADAQLISITNQEEDNFVYTLASHVDSNFWIGANDKAVEGTWNWLSGEPWMYCNFAAGTSDQAPNGGTNENCLFRTMSSTFNGWDDFPCTNSFMFVCEKAIQ